MIAPDKDLGREVSAKLYARFPGDTTGRTARALNCTERAAENMLNGHLSARTIQWLTDAFGPMFLVEAIMATAGTTVDQYLLLQAAEALDRAEALLAEADDLKSLSSFVRRSQ